MMDRRMRNALDNYITGRYGEDQFRASDPEEVEPLESDNTDDEVLDDSERDPDLDEDEEYYDEDFDEEAEGDEEEEE